MFRLRFYAGVAAGTGLGLYLLGAHPALSLLTGLTAPVLLVALPGFLRGAWTGLGTPGRREQRAEAMSGVEFEEHIAQIARSCGVPVIMTPASGDWGVDLILGRRPNRVAVQCKRKSRPVGPGAIQEVVAGAPMQDCATTMVVSNQSFTPAARRLAELHGCTLVGDSELPQLRRIIRRLTS